MREWAADLLAGDPAGRGLSRCRRLAELTGLPPGPIWRWGLVERVSTGLLNVKAGFEGANDFLAVADVWALAEPPRL
jgi:streptomycin 6-kinase